MSATDIATLVSSLSGDLATIGAGVVTLAMVAAGGLWVKRLLGF